ncbi:hypothetical protein EWD94_23380 [Salmonella enterica subsp. enterica serovar Newport]|nr:hypothetical protein [Salmonella enterica subsp. enterica serovar Newport]
MKCKQLKNVDRKNLILMNEGEVKISFDQSGRLIHSLKQRVCDDIKIAERIFENSYLPVRTECQEEARYYFYLQPEPATGTEKTIKFFDDRGGGLHEKVDLLAAC